MKKILLPNILLVNKNEVTTQMKQSVSKQKTQ